MNSYHKTLKGHIDSTRLTGRPSGLGGSGFSLVISLKELKITIRSFLPSPTEMVLRNGGSEYFSSRKYFSITLVVL